MDYCTKQDLADVKEELKSDITALSVKIDRLEAGMLNIEKQLEQNTTMLWFIAKAVMGNTAIQDLKAKSE